MGTRKVEVNPKVKQRHLKHVASCTNKKCGVALKCNVPSQKELMTMVLNEVKLYICMELLWIYYGQTGLYQVT